MKKIQIIRGFNDVLPTQSYKWHYLESKIRKVLESYNYKEVRLPILERSELFHRSVGQDSDVVSKETYDFEDRNSEKVTLRPEGTAGCVRMAIENNLISRGQARKLWYQGPMFRCERPQQGRYRQFYQIGIEAYGFAGLGIDLEILSIAWQLFKDIRLSDYIVLEINTLGSSENRQLYAKALVEYLKPYENKLDKDSIKRLATNPLRILDSKNESTKVILQNAPQLFNFIDEKFKIAFKYICKYLRLIGVKYKVNVKLVRGLDYYSGLVFEWTTDKLGAQSSICAGGRYDNLITTLGGPESYAIGFAIGIDRLLLLLETIDIMPPDKSVCNVFFIIKSNIYYKILPTINHIRSHFTNVLNFDLDLKLGSLKSQFKKAYKSSASVALVIGEEEFSNNSVKIKYLHSKRKNLEIPFDDLFIFLNNI